jgi:hypothetical protein
MLLISEPHERKEMFIKRKTRYSCEQKFRFDQFIDDINRTAQLNSMKFSVNEDIKVKNRLQKRNSHFPLTFLEIFHHKAMSIEQKFRFDRVFRPFDES